MRKREKFYKYMSVINFLSLIMQLFPVYLVKILFRRFKYSENNLGFLVRYLCAKRLLKNCGNNVAIFQGVTLLNLNKLSIGNNVSIHPMCYIDAKGTIKIGNDVSIAHNVSILSTEHEYRDLTLNIKDQGSIEKEVILENNIWIGAGVRILAGTHIEEGVVVGAGSVTKGTLLKNTIYGGILAKKIKERK